MLNAKLLMEINDFIATNNNYYLGKHKIIYKAKQKQQL